MTCLLFIIFFYLLSFYFQVGAENRTAVCGKTYILWWSPSPVRVRSLFLSHMVTGHLVSCRRPRHKDPSRVGGVAERHVTVVRDCVIAPWPVWTMKPTWLAQTSVANQVRLLVSIFFSFLALSQ